jgi:hypothetical protein
LILVLASMGFLGSMVGAVMLAANGGKIDYKQQFGSQPNMDVNPEAMKKLEAYAPSHTAKNLGATIAGLLAASLLIVGAVASIYPFRWGPAALTMGCIVAILFLLIQGWLVQSISGDVLRVMNEYPDDFFSPKGNAGEQEVTVFTTIFKTTYTAMPIANWIFAGMKIIFYVAVIAYLRKANVREYVQGTST